jgi:hypothetical protein
MKKKHKYESVNTKCPICKEPAWQGASYFRCTNTVCKNYDAPTHFLFLEEMETADTWPPPPVQLEFNFDEED